MTRHASLLFFSSLLTVAAGCDGNVVADVAGSAAGSGASSSTGTGTGTATGTGGVTTVTTTTTTTTTISTTTTTSTTTGTGGCTGSTIVVVPDNGPANLLDVNCGGGLWNPTMSSEPVAFIFSGGPTQVEGLEVVGCSKLAMGGSVKLSALNVLGAGTYSAGDIRYAAPGGDVWGMKGDPVKVDITHLGVVSDFVDGTFEAPSLHVMNGTATHQLTGTFHVCRVPDEILP
jgi:hypothetical protein